MRIVPRLMLLLFCTLAVAGFSSAAGAQQQAAVTGPVVQVPETSFDFGEVVEGKDYVHDFIIKNVGTAPLEIKKVLAS